MEAGRILFESNPDIQKRTMHLLKEAKPDLRLPEVDLEQRIEAEAKKREELKEEFEARLIKDNVERREREVKAQIEAAGFTVDEINQLVKEEGFTTLSQALKFAELKRQTAEPGITDFGRPHGVRDMRPATDWRGLNVAQLKEKSADIMRDGITELMRRARGGR